MHSYHSTARASITQVVAAVCMLAAGDRTPTLPAQQRPTDERVDRLFAEWDRPESPGCALGVIRDGRLVYGRGYGMANLDYDIPNSPQMVYYVGSVTKQFTAAAVALLAIQGRLSLDDDIRKYVPEMPDYAARYGRPVTIRNLIHHTSGIRDMYVLMDLAGRRLEDVFPDEDALALLARQRQLNFPPGSDYAYSNSGYWLLGKIVQRVTGRSLREYADDQIFRPLGMTETHFHDDPGHVMKHRAMSYQPDGHGGFRISYLQNFDKIGAGGLYSTVEDLRKWDQNYYTHQVGGDALQAMIHTRGVLTSGDTLSYAFGNEIGTYRGLRTVSHEGAMMGYRAHILRFPVQHFTVIETCNLGTISPGRIARRIADIYLGDQMAPALAVEGKARATGVSAGDGPTPEELAERSGTYSNAETGEVWQIAVQDGQLVATAAGTRLPLEALSATRFRDAGGEGLEFAFERPSAGALYRLRLARVGAPAELLERAPVVAPAATALVGLAGDYASDELQVTYHIVAEGGRLVLRRPNAPAAPLAPVTPDVYQAGPIVLHVQRQAGRPSSFTVWVDRVRNIRFTRRQGP
jgi:CubicO group peptidase (beta-lactamase class C family)